MSRQLTGECTQCRICEEFAKVAPEGPDRLVNTLVDLYNTFQGCHHWPHISSILLSRHSMTSLMTCVFEDGKFADGCCSSSWGSLKAATLDRQGKARQFWQLAFIMASKAT